MSREWDGMRPAQIRTAIERATERQAGVLANWVDLYVAAGRALQAAESGTIAETRRWLHAAADIEQDLDGTATFAQLAESLP